MANTDLILKLYEIGAVKFGEFKLKSGIVSPIYIDLRVIISFPPVLKEVSQLIWNVCKFNGVKCDNVCGVPYTALPIATCISVENDVPMVIKRKEAKDYGTKKMIEGVFKQGESCLIIEDVVTTGSSVRETAECLREHGLQVDNAIVLLDRDQGGRGALVKHGIRLFNAFTLPEVLDVLLKADKIKAPIVQEAKNFLSANSIDQTKGVKMFERQGKGDEMEKVYDLTKRPIRTYRERAALCKNRISAKLMLIMEEKKTNLCLSADVDSAVEMLELAESVGPYICCIKTHVDTLSHFDISVMIRLQQLAQKHNFVVFEDRKFADIGNTVKSQVSGGVYRIAEWADIINAHVLPGPGVLKGLQAGAKLVDSELGCLLIAQMSTKGNLLNEMYTKECVKMAGDFDEFVVGFISTSRVSSNPSHLHFSPGVKLQPDTDSMGQQYLTPAEVICNRGSDIIIVGRGILTSSNRIHAARSFRDAGWNAYLSRPKC